MSYYILEEILDHPLLIVAAIVPAIALMILVYCFDRLEKEPIRLLLHLVLMGILSTTLAAYAEKTLSVWLYYFVRDDDSFLYNFLMYFGVVAVSEEGFKYLFMRTRTWRRRDFNCQFDGVVYAVFVSLGFALWENLSYCLSYGWDTALLRAVTAVPLHACCGVFMGLFYGAAKRYQVAGNNRQSFLYRLLALVVPMLVHGAYDFLATISDEGWTEIAFIAFIVVVFAVAFFSMRRASKQDRYVDETTIPESDIIDEDEISDIQ